MKSGVDLPVSALTSANTHCASRSRSAAVLLMLSAAHEALRFHAKTWPTALFRNAICRLFDIFLKIDFFLPLRFSTMRMTPKKKKPEGMASSRQRCD
jgi:hypothetical protein